MKCHRCGSTADTHLDRDGHCARCVGELAVLVAQDRARKVARFSGKDLSGWNR